MSNSKQFNESFKQVPVIETERLVLRPFAYEDMPDYKAFFTDPDVQRYLGGIPIPMDAKSERQWVDNINGRCLKAKLVFTWCIELKETGRVIGRCDLGGFVLKSMADIAYYLSKDYWNKGFISEAVNAVICFGFERLGLHRIQATVMPENEASIRVLEKVGFSREGLLRQYSFGREFHDTVMMAILSKDWRK
jgi:[ribosomal protein S5]-alanine N-acetyltransferase